jgi:hypothetical protein
MVSNPGKFWSSFVGRLLTVHGIDPGQTILDKVSHSGKFNSLSRRVAGMKNKMKGANECFTVVLVLWADSVDSNWRFDREKSVRSYEGHLLCRERSLLCQKFLLSMKELMPLTESFHIAYFTRRFTRIGVQRINSARKKLVQMLNL